jgi:uncharacterized protein YbjT (DUF2867 family)
MRKILVIGATGMVGRRLTQTLLAEGFNVRCSVRNLESSRTKLPASCELVQGDIADLTSMQAAFHSVDAAYLCFHTISSQPNGAASDSFVETELKGIANILTACRANNVQRLVYITFLGTSPDATTSWSRERWKAEQQLLNSGLNVTILRPGQIVGKGGHGFDMMMSQARRRFALVLGSGNQKMRNIALDDFVYYLVQALDEPHTFGKAFDVGCDDVLTGNQMIDVAAEVLGRPQPTKIHLPGSLLKPAAGLIERMAKLPKGAFRDLLTGMGTDMVGDPRPIRAVFPRPPLNYKQAIQKALQS